jgi:hypothetical protein
MKVEIEKKNKKDKNIFYLSGERKEWKDDRRW